MTLYFACQKQTYTNNNKMQAFLFSNQSYSQMPRKNGASTPILKIAKNKIRIISNLPLIIFRRRTLKLRKLKIFNP